MVHILANDHSFLADCNMYCPVLRITKDSRKDVRNLSIPFDVSDRYAAFTPKYIILSKEVPVGVISLVNRGDGWKCGGYYFLYGALRKIARIGNQCVYEIEDHFI